MENIQDDLKVIEERIISENKDFNLAEVRTELAKQRTIMANERTFNAWLRTGLSLVLAGLAIANFIGSTSEAHTYAMLTGIIFVSVGILTYILAFLSYINNMKVIDYTSKKLTRLVNLLMIVTIAMIISAILILGLLLYWW